MKHWSIIFFFCCSFFCTAEENLIDLVVQRERIKKKLERIGYVKWKKANSYLVEQLIASKKTEVDIVTMEHKLLKLKNIFEASKKYQTQTLEKLALSNDPELQTKKGDYVAINTKTEETIRQHEEKIKSWKALLGKQQNLVTKLTKIEKQLGEKVESSRSQIDVLIRQWEGLDKQIKQADLKVQNDGEK